MLNEQPGAPASVTVKVWPATVRVAVCVDVVVFAATSKVTLPVPEPVAPVAMLTHAALLVAVHEHPAVVVTAIDPEPPAAAKL
jgi:hypothetical protein